MLGSGDREKPLDDTYWPNSYAVQNYFFMIKDKPIGPDWLERRERNLRSTKVICKDSLLEITGAAQTRRRGPGRCQGLVPAGLNDRMSRS